MQAGNDRANMSTDKKVKLESSDGKILEVDEPVAFEMQTVKDMIETCAETESKPVYRLPFCSSTLAKVIEYCRYQLESEKSSNEKPEVLEDKAKEWDAEFLEVDQTTLFDLLLAAEYLQVKRLVKLTQTVADDIIKDKDIGARRYERFSNVVEWEPEWARSL